MTFKNNATYRFICRADTGRSLNVYASAGTAPSLSNVCLWTSSSSDMGQQWIYKESGSNKYFVCKANPSVALDMYTGSTSGQNNVNAHVYAPSSTSYLAFEDTDSGYIKIKLARYSNKYLTANQGNNGTSNGRTTHDAGNVYWYAGGLTDHSQEWKPILVDDGGSSSGGSGNGTIIEGQRPSTLNYDSAPYKVPFNRFHQDYAPGNGTAQCTWHCYGRAKEVMGVTINFSQSGGNNAGMWWSRVTNCDKSSTPRANSIAVWQDGGYGHVAYVEKVVGSNVYISEANYAGLLNQLDPADGKVVKLSIDAMKSRSNGRFKLAGYLYL